MVAREEIVRTIASVFVVKTRKWNEQNYPYWEDFSTWEKNTQAHKVLHEHMDHPKICHRAIHVLGSGRVTYMDTDIYVDGKWIVESYDPRSSDPEYKEFLRLKAKFDE